MKTVIWLIAGALGLLGLVFLLSATHQNTLVRLAIGSLCIVAAIALIVVTRLRPVEHVHRMELDLPGDVELKQTTCQQCGATLGTKSVSVAAGAVYVNCEFCGSSYQIEEQPKW